MIYQVRLSGRQKPTGALSPAKAGSGFLLATLPRAALRSTSFRYACPGLNSAASFAGSLNGFESKAVWFALILLLTLVGQGCSHGINSGTRGLPALSTPPMAVTSSADVVKVHAADVSIAAGGQADATVTLSISPGYHINANPATYPYLIATEVKITPAPDGPCVRMGKAVYPVAVSKQFAFEKKPLAVYEGEAVINIPLHLPVPKEGGCYGYLIKGAHDSLPIEMRVQACDDEKCYPPATLNSTISLTVQ